MGCQSDVDLGNDLTFTITTHDPSTAAITDADSPPTYRVYEDETGAAILNGTMTKLDDVNTTGFYSELIACTTGNGFEVGKSYNIYIEATVGGDTGGMSYGFTVHVPRSISTGVSFTYTVVDINTGLPIPGVRVTISTDIAGTNVIWGGDTDAFGVARDDFGNLPLLDPGVYFMWRSIAGYIFTNPDQETVS